MGIRREREREMERISLSLSLLVPSPSEAPNAAEAASRSSEQFWAGLNCPRSLCTLGVVREAAPEKPDSARKRPREWE
eukprot:10923383-Alexandrium_andersonii.AAC.1